MGVWPLLEPPESTAEQHSAGFSVRPRSFTSSEQKNHKSGKEIKVGGISAVSWSFRSVPTGGATVLASVRIDRRRHLPDRRSYREKTKAVKKEGHTHTRSQ